MQDKDNKDKILIIEDESRIVDLLRLRLEKEDYQVIHASKLEDGVEKEEQERPDLVILDLGLPDGDGMEFIRTVRQSSMVPIIVVSARFEESDKVQALDAGANDYVTKPFGMEELMARVRSVLRTNMLLRKGEMAEDGKNLVRFGNLTVDYANHRVMVDGQEIHLTKTEYKILEYLSQNADRLLTYEEIIRYTWEWMDSVSVKKLQVNMANIRKKLGEVPGERSWIYNELGVGYRMRQSDSRGKVLLERT